MVLSAALEDWRESRRQRFLGSVDWSLTRGVEIGPPAAPLARRPEADVRYVDLVETAELKQKYADDPNVELDDIVSVDAVWGSKTLPECFADAADFDWVIASHVVEHVPDLIGWLTEIGSILGNSGRLYLAVPDYRVTFDRFRSTSSLAEVIAAHLEGAQQPSLAQIFSQTLYFSHLTANEIWQASPDPAQHLSLTQLKTAWETTRYAAQSGDAVDIHCWVFTPRTFLETMIALSELGLLGYRCLEFSTTAAGENEFFVTLEKLDPADAQGSVAAGADFRARLLALQHAEQPSGTLTHEEYLADVLARPTHGSIAPAALPQVATSSWRSRVSVAPQAHKRSEWLGRRAELPPAATLGTEFPPHEPFYSGYDQVIDADHAQIAELAGAGGMVNMGLPGFLRVADAQTLYELAYFCAGDVLELIAHTPLPSLFMSQAIGNSASGARLVSVETIDAYAPLGQGVIESLGLHEVRDSHAGDPLAVMDVCAAKEQRFGLVFIDFTQSSEVLAPVVARLPGLLAAGALVVFHDFNDVNNAGPTPEYEIYSVVAAMINSKEFAFVGVVGCCAVLQLESTEHGHLAK